jgi:hypothetical protein
MQFFFDGMFGQTKNLMVSPDTKSPMPLYSEFIIGTIFICSWADVTFCNSKLRQTPCRISIGVRRRFHRQCNQFQAIEGSDMVAGRS